jgi:hypothetical protein
MTSPRAEGDDQGAGAGVTDEVGEAGDTDEARATGGSRGAGEAGTGPVTRVPLDKAGAGHLRVARGLSSARLTVRSDLGDLLHGRWRREPAITAEDGDVTLTFPRGRRLRRGTDEIVLSSSVPWDISVQGGVDQVGADLRWLKLRSLVVAGGGSRLTLALGKPEGEVPIRFRSVDRVTIRRPAESQVRVHVHKGASQVVVDDQSYGAIGGETVLTTGPVLHNFYNVEVVAARRLRVTTY